MNNTAKELHKKITNHTAKVGIIGLGYVGLPLALCFAEKDFNVLGFDIDPAKVDKLNRGDCYIKHLDRTRLKRAIGLEKCEGDSDCNTQGSRFLEATSDFSRLSECDAILICVPTPLGPHKEPDLNYVENSTKQIRKTLRKGQLIILESTTYPGTTDELLREILESSIETHDGEGPQEKIAIECDAIQNSKFKIQNLSSPVLGDDYFLAFSPEREDPGNPNYGTKNIPKVVGGVDEVSGDLAEALYAEVLDSTVRVKNARTAESTKLMENIFRAVNIALVNELKMVFEKMDVDIWAVLDAAETKPFGFMRFNPGPGLGGHCIPLDPYYLAWKAREVGQPTRFIELAGEINTQMPHYVVERLAEALNEHGKPVKGSKILILGLAYKPNIDDPRESPAFEIIHLLLERGAEVSYHDPHIPFAPSMRSWPDLPTMASVSISGQSLTYVDAAVIVTDHSSVDYRQIVSNVPVVIDTRWAVKAEGVVKA